jgi:hypothetical protein
MGKLVLMLLLAVGFAAHAQSPNLNINKVTPGPPKPRAPESVAAAVQAAAPDRLASIGKKLQEIQGSLLSSAEMVGRLRAVRPRTPGEKADLAQNGQALMGRINEDRRSLNFVQDSVIGMARQPLSQSEKVQAESHLKSITGLKQNAQTLAGLAQEVVRQNSEKPGAIAR